MTRWRRCREMVMVMVMIMMMIMMVEGQQGQAPQTHQQKDELCQTQKTCGDCIQTPECMWCTKPFAEPTKEDDNTTSNQVLYRCRHTSVDLSTFCEEQDQLENPQNQAQVLQNKPLTALQGNEGNQGSGNQGTGDGEEEIIQLTPQRMKLTLRRGVSQTINITYRLARDYPVDLYYLMDLSNSMKDDKDQLAALGSKLAGLLSNLTKQYQLGFGSFVDKVLMPYADTSPVKLQSPCAGCARPYSFRNDLPLQNGAQLFREKVEGASISGNMDAPEGGFDALMQVMVCDQEIGWRNQSRKILIFSTDAKFHYAGDGRLAGVILPNDMTCHLNQDMEYTHYDQLDYPSIAQINKVASEKKINVIFAVSSHEDLYQELSKRVKDSSYGKLARDSANVVDLVQQQYDKISSEVSLTDNRSGGVKIVYQAKCQASKPWVTTNKCKGIKPNDTIQFSLEVTATQCPSDGQQTVKHMVEIGTFQDKLLLEVEVECSCGCDSEEENVVNSIECSHQGTSVCGICDCNEGYRGVTCNCSNDNSDSSDRDLALCRAPDDHRICSGLGFCSCGSCNCNKDLSGAYCQCNQRKCQIGGKECSGQGTCDCNRCVCDDGYTGVLCECPDNSYCIAPGATEECSGHGDCMCGKCRCRHEQGTTYTGKYCDECPTCETGRCFDFSECVQCMHFESGPLAGDPCEACNITTYTTDSLNGQIASGANPCIFEDEEGCYFNFTYRYNEAVTPSGSLPYDIYVQRERQCPPPPPVLGIVFGLIAGIVALGLLTLLVWKIATTIHDRREFAKFEQERSGAQWNAEENPLYQRAATTFQNPAFGGTQQQSQ